MAEIIPRWEWRTFGTWFGSAAEARLAEQAITGIVDSDETYLLSEAVPTTKLRGGLMDVKELVETDEHGLQQWRPVMKAAFPIPAAEAARVLESVGLPAPALGRPAYDETQFLDEVAVPAGMRPVAVHKHRVRHRIGGCTAEVTDVTADGIPARTVAIESEDAQAVVAAVRAMGLDGFLNRAYGPGLKAMLARLPDRYAVIDVGTNSVKFHVGEREPDGTWVRIRDRAELTRLGEGLEERGEISDAAAERTAAAIATMAGEARADGVLAIAAVGTAGLRIARNRDDVIDAIRRRAGIEVEVVSGEEESRLAFLAARASLGFGGGTVAVFDTGGGSTQLTFGHDDLVDERFSVEVGAVRYTERFGLAGVTSEGTLAEALAAISADLGRLDGRPPVDGLVGMGGAMTNLAAVRHGLAAYDPDVVHGTVLSRAEVDQQIERFRALDAAERARIPGLQPKRADVILAGACIVRTVMDKLGRDRLTVSDRGLRHGLLAERFGMPAGSGRP